MTEPIASRGLLRLWGKTAKPKKRKKRSFLSLFTNGTALPEHLNSFPPSAVHFREDAVYWGLRNLPVEDAVKHFLICGVSGSGKTTAIKLFLQSIAPRFLNARLEPEQLIVFDARTDMVPFLAGLGLGHTQEHVHILNPFDARSSVWNIAEAVQSPAMARHLATLLIPEEKQSNAPYFPNAAREAVYAVILGLNEVAGASWSLRDLLCALESKENIQGVTSHHRRAKAIAAQFLADDKHFPGILTQIATKIGPFEQVAALWGSNKSGRKFTIKGFLDRPGVLILGNDDVLKDSLWPLTGC